jgi:hypothetical protein
MSLDKHSFVFSYSFWSFPKIVRSAPTSEVMLCICNIIQFRFNSFIIVCVPFWDPPLSKLIKNLHTLRLLFCKVLWVKQLIEPCIHHYSSIQNNLLSAQNIPSTSPSEPFLPPNPLQLLDSLFSISASFTFYRI